MDAYTVWNVRVMPNMTIADVCAKLAKKIDAKYRFVELYKINGKKSMYLHCFGVILPVTFQSYS